MTGGIFVNKRTILTSAPANPDVKLHRPFPLPTSSCFLKPAQTQRLPTLALCVISSVPVTTRTSIAGEFVCFLPLKVVGFWFVEWFRSFEPNIYRFRPHFAVLHFITVVFFFPVWPRAFSPLRRRRWERPLQVSLLVFHHWKLLGFDLWIYLRILSPIFIVFIPIW